MKTYFRVLFQKRGWIIEYKNGLPGSWDKIICKEGDMVRFYQDLGYARVLCRDLRRGLIPDVIFNKPKKDGKETKENE